MKVPPLEMTTEQARAELAALRVDMSVAVVRAKNPFNVGAIIRVAHSFLVREIFLIGSEPYYQKASMGMHRYENIVECPDPSDFLARVRGRPLFSVERDQARTTLWQVDYPADVVLLFGSEDEGVPAELLARSEQVIAIPMYGINHSYPVAVAAGMVLCEWARRRDPRGAGAAQTATRGSPAGRAGALDEAHPEHNGAKREKRAREDEVTRR